MTVLENMIGEVGNAIVEDRLTRALDNARVAEATAPRKARRVRTRRGTWRHILSRSFTTVPIGDQRGMRG
jgi:hypothetical protein